MPLSAAQELFHESLPAQIQDAISADELASQVVVYPEDGVSEAEVAAAIEDEIDNVNTLTGAEFDEQVGSATAIFNAIIIGVAVISLVGGLSVINTMAMSVAERTREIGIKRAIGGSRADHPRAGRRGRADRPLWRPDRIGAGGGGGGDRQRGRPRFRDDPVRADQGTAAFAVAFSTILGIVAGLVPAWSAARLDPVEALRYE